MKQEYPDNVNPAALAILQEVIIPSFVASIEDSPLVLEFGCSTGALGAKILEEMPNTTWIGVDYSDNALAIASSRLSRVVKADLNHIRIEDLGRLADGPELVIMVDVLEHVYEPSSFIEKVSNAFPDAKILCVLPNIACYQTYDRISIHDFPYDDSGIFDKSHRTFYTVKSALRFFNGAGYALEAGPVFLLDPAVSHINLDTIFYPYIFSKGSYSICVRNRDELLSLCSYGFGYLFQPSR